MHFDQFLFRKDKLEDIYEVDLFNKLICVPYCMLVLFYREFRIFKEILFTQK